MSSQLSQHYAYHQCVKFDSGLPMAVGQIFHVSSVNSFADYGDDKKAIRQFGFEVMVNLCERLIAEGVPSMHFTA